MDCRRRWAVDDDRSRRWVVDDDRYPRRWVVDDDRSRIAFYQSQAKVSLDRIDKNLDRIRKNLRSIRPMRMSSATIPRYSSPSSSVSRERHQIGNKSASSDDYPPLELPLQWRDPPPQYPPLELPLKWRNPPPDHLIHNQPKLLVHDLPPLQPHPVTYNPTFATSRDQDDNPTSLPSSTRCCFQIATKSVHESSPTRDIFDTDLLALQSSDPKPVSASVRTTLSLPLPLSLNPRYSTPDPTVEATEKPFNKISGDECPVYPNPPHIYSIPSPQCSESHQSQNTRYSSITKPLVAAHKCKVSDDAEENTEVVSPTNEAFPISEAAASNQNNIIKSKRYILHSVERTLDSSDLVNDFYLHMFDWRSIIFLSIAFGNTADLWNAPKGSTSEPVTVEDDLGPVASVKWALDGLSLAIGLSNFEFQLRDSSSALRLRTLNEIHRSNIGAVAWNNNILTTGGIKDVFITGVQMLDAKSTNKANPTPCSQAARHNVADDFVQLSVEYFLAEIDLMSPDDNRITSETLDGHLLVKATSPHISLQEYRIWDTSGRSTASFSLLEEVGKLNSSTPWIIMMWALVQSGQFIQAISLFQKMQILGFEPNVVAIRCLVTAYTHLGALLIGKVIHGYVRFFDNMVYRDIVTWSSMLKSYDIPGMGLQAIKLFHLMQEARVSPNSITFLSLLSSCSHSSLLNEGCQVFSSMTENFGIKADLSNYTCMVHLLARAKKLTEALNLIHSMDVKPDWRIFEELISALTIGEPVTQNIHNDAESKLSFPKDNFIDSFEMHTTEKLEVLIIFLHIGRNLDDVFFIKAWQPGVAFHLLRLVAFQNDLIKTREAMDQRCKVFDPGGFTSISHSIMRLDGVKVFCCKGRMM